ncbi:hypothetical protein KA183_13145 [bacterium]|nr:hypothetical protein [bacterium]QQR57775.1 MAG: hypothetical protein IPG59_22855 [Candidatus Melainabacteria bacterium]
MDDQHINNLTVNKLNFLDSESRLRASLGEDEGGAYYLRMFDQSGKIRTQIGMGLDGQSHICLNHGDGSPHLLLIVDVEGNNRIVAYDNVGNTRFQLSIEGDGSSSTIKLVNSNEKPLAIIGAGMDERGIEQASIAIFDNGGNIIHLAP